MSVCHRLECQRRTGSAVAAQARFPVERQFVERSSSQFARVSDGGRQAAYSFCPSCVSTVVYRDEGDPGVVAVALGAFADPGFPAPTTSFFERRMHGWIDLAQGIEDNW